MLFLGTVCTSIVLLLGLFYRSQLTNIGSKSILITRAVLLLCIGLLVGGNMARVSSSEAPAPPAAMQRLATIPNNTKTAIGLAQNSREITCDELNALTSDLFLLYVKTLNYHWNVTGLAFGYLHPFFEEMYEEIFALIDRSAERVRALGGISAGSMQSFTQNSDLSEESRIALKDEEMLSSLLFDIQAIIREIRIFIPRTQTYRDAGTETMLGEFLEILEKRAWMLRSSLS